MNMTYETLLKDYIPDTTFSMICLIFLAVSTILWPCHIQYCWAENNVKWIQHLSVQPKSY